jgi:hypothetical protein
MRCKACDANLTDYESTKKDPLTGEFLDLCSGCSRKASSVPVEVLDNVSEEDFNR